MGVSSGIELFVMRRINNLHGQSMCRSSAIIVLIFHISPNHNKFLFARRS